MKQIERAIIGHYDQRRGQPKHRNIWIYRLGIMAVSTAPSPSGRDAIYINQTLAELRGQGVAELAFGVNSPKVTVLARKGGDAGWTPISESPDGIDRVAAIARTFNRYSEPLPTPLSRMAALCVVLSKHLKIEIKELPSRATRTDVQAGFATTDPVQLDELF